MGSSSRTSRIRPSLQLQDKFTELSLSPLGIAHNYLQETVILTDYETDEEGNYTKSNGKKKRQFIEYDDTDFTNDIRRDLEAYNQLLRRYLYRHSHFGRTVCCQDEEGWLNPTYQD